MKKFLKAVVVRLPLGMLVVLLVLGVLYLCLPLPVDEDLHIQLEGMTDVMIYWHDPDGNVVQEQRSVTEEELEALREWERWYPGPEDLP